MNFRKSKGGKKALVTLDITALVDVVFLLLIFLLVTTTFKRDEHAFVIDLVSSSGEQVTITSDKTTVYIDTEGDLYLLTAQSTATPSDPARGESVSFEELKSRLEVLRERRPDESVAIRGAKTANYQRVVDVVNVLESVGFRDVSFAYEQNAD